MCLEIISKVKEPFLVPCIGVLEICSPKRLIVFCVYIQNQSCIQRLRLWFKCLLTSGGWWELGRCGDKIGSELVIVEAE